MTTSGNRVSEMKNDNHPDTCRSIEDIPGTVVVTEKNRISDCVLQAQVRCPSPLKPRSHFLLLLSSSVKIKVISPSCLIDVNIRVYSPSKVLPPPRPYKKSLQHQTSHYFFFKLSIAGDQNVCLAKQVCYMKSLFGIWFV